MVHQADTVAAKQALRHAIRSRRSALTADQLRVWSMALTRVVLRSSSWIDARGVAGFIGVRGEPDTRELLQATIDAGKVLYLPRVVSAGRLEFLPVASLEDLVTATFGLLEPVAGPAGFAVPDHEHGIDLVLVPGLAFGRDGGRLGFGKGFYDRALSPMADQRHPLRLGICFSPFLDPVEGRIPCEPHDVRMHAVATEQGIVSFGGDLNDP